MKTCFVVLFAALCALLPPLAPAHAATIGVITHDYGAGGFTPGGNSQVNANSVTVSEADTSPFNDSFDFSGLTYDTIDSLTLTVNFADAGPLVFGGFFAIEAWRLNVTGSDGGATTDDFTSFLFDADAPMSFVFDATTDTGDVDVFATALATQSVDFFFDEISFFGNNFELFSASLTVEGTIAAVPLPAPVLLLLAALGGLGVASRRRRRTAEEA